ncbi:RNA 2',3'-cyclic phosphodiesterase [Commensalibacter papalotli (ex Botero et al. 2024)]|uniref:3'-cyclic phosphodiesterase (2'-5' RNA ligase) (ThpR) (PDB:1IUH) (PUBMED:25239919) n=1 Tax=Commensalibacter papalotli (ex Botero et al. 2024) TaxID=2972766 RepID=A0ABM9HJY6_9PROT|nr:RNA 2',3'-cyclic phosphodiesterase [Commensalibacter papalotli (ex Botero et al. 2024)]CAI3924024.1 3'-cyclic phosphodiesterase (2'-5' RNA ligase) (ThpR) (PDB:1IUH) (PUBMED:25239919) [Commensalibacter papalotli (ex Botero et al. 2024)]CAI3928004.1 3'-cyclic phosphodiesterase (2'-5' RNA ligase) (ThpR) (PDB:1IUH) (PUBMED:25239919) [Commensalibacter papalotli (ex Botero et al. 2024)]
MRLFIGLTIPDPICTQIGSLRGSLPSIHWNDPDTYHISLCDIGEINSNVLLNDLDLALEKIGFNNFELSIQGVSHYTSPTQEIKLCATVLPTSSLSLLKNKIEYINRKLGIKTKKKHFTPHITLAKGIGINQEQISNWLFKYNLFKTEPFQICQFSLFSSFPNKKEFNCDIVSTYLLR